MMFFLSIAEFLISVLVIAIFVTQIFIPLWNEEKLAPLFRKKLKHLDAEIAEVNEEVSIAQTQNKLRQMKKVVEKFRSEDESQVEPESQPKPQAEPKPKRTRKRKGDVE